MKNSMLACLPFVVSSSSLCDLFEEQNFLRSVHFHFQFQPCDFSPESLTIISFSSRRRKKKDLKVNKSQRRLLARGEFLIWGNFQHLMSTVCCCMQKDFVKQHHFASLIRYKFTFYISLFLTKSPLSRPSFFYIYPPSSVDSFKSQ